MRHNAWAQWQWGAGNQHGVRREAIVFEALAAVHAEARGSRPHRAMVVEVRRQGRVVQGLFEGSRPQSRTCSERDATRRTRLRCSRDSAGKSSNILEASFAMRAHSPLFLCCLCDFMHFLPLSQEG